MTNDQLSRKRAAVASTRRRKPLNPPTTMVPDISQRVEEVKSLPDLRWDKVQALRGAIATGEYDVVSRVEDLLNRLSEDLAALTSPAE